MRTLVIAEKPSQAADLKKALGSSYGEILAAQGHLIRIAEPGEVKPEWEKWSYDVLWPGKFYPLRADEGDGKGPRLRSIKQALARVDRVIIATDCDREGQLIGEEILEYLNFGGKVERAMFTAQDPVTLKKAFSNLKPNDVYRGLGDAARARQQADQVFNLTMTRGATLAFRAPGAKGALGVGRVKTAVLAIVCMRELEITNFKPEIYFTIEASARAGKDRSVQLRHSPREEDRITSQKLADAIVAAANSFKGPISVEVEPNKTKGPPKLPDLPDMQKAMGGKGWTAKKTLEVAQSLYEKHLITYPRAEAKYLAEAQIGDVPGILEKLKGLSFIDKAIPGEPVIRKGKNGHFSDEALKGVSHHAVVPNINSEDPFASAWKTMSRDEQQLFEVIARRFVAAVSPNFVYDQTVLSVQVKAEGQDREFSAVGNVVKQLGWRAALGQEEAEKDDDEEVSLPPFKDGEQVSLHEAAKETKQTKPPPRFNEGTLIEAMQNAWRYVAEGPIQERLKECKGIGTPATRDSIIDGLKKQAQIAVDRGRIVPTNDGLAFYQLLKSKLPSLVDPGSTALMEMKLDGVVDGKFDALEVVEEIAEQAKRLSVIIQKSEGAMSFGSGRRNPPSPAMLNAANAIAKNKKIELPRDVTQSFDACKAFLDKHPRDPNATPARPSEKQIELARSIAEKKGAALPQSALESSKALSQWIDANMDKRLPVSGARASAAKRKRK